MSEQSAFTRPRTVLILATVCCLLWGSAYPAIKLGYGLFQIALYDTPSKLVFAGYRFVLAGGLLLVLAAIWNKPIFRFSARDFGRIGVLGVAQTSLQYVFFYIGLAFTTGVKASVMNATGSFFSVLLAHFIYHNDKLSIRRIAGCALGFCGVMVVNVGHGLLDFSFNPKGEGFIMLAAFILSAASIYGKKLSQYMDSMVLTGHQLAIGGIVLCLSGYGLGGTLVFVSFKALCVLVYLAMLSAIAFALWTLLLKHNRVGVVAIFNFLIPVFGTVLSSIFLNESVLEWKNAVALVLVCGGVWLVTGEEKMPRLELRAEP